MLAARASAARNIARSARRFATVVDSAGVKVAAADNGEPTTAVTVLVKAGSRYETKPGVAHALKNFAFKVGRRGRVCVVGGTLLTTERVLLYRAPTSVRRWAPSGRRSSTAASSHQASRGSTLR